MGVESFFINAKMNEKMNLAQLKSFFEANNYVVSPYITKYEGFFQKKTISNFDIVINKIVVINIDTDFISFQACFSCYDKAIKIISTVIKDLNEKNFIQYLFYGKNIFRVSDDIYKIIGELNKERYIYFCNNYTSKKIDLLPNEFYTYYRKNRKFLKK